MWCSEPVATDTIQLDTLAINGGETYAQIFIGTCSLITDVYGMISLAQFPGTLSNNTTQCGAPTKLISDHAQVEISKRIQEILHTLYIGSWQSEPHYQHQNLAEWWYQDVKQIWNTVLDCTSVPAYCWLLCLIYVCFILNNCFSDNIKAIPLHIAMGTMNDISPLLSFEFYGPIYYHMDDTLFPPRARISVVAGSVSVRMLATTWPTRSLPMIHSRLSIIQIYAWHVIPSWRTFIKIL